MKSISKLFWLLALTASVFGSVGCKQITPQGAASLTTAAVYAFGRNNPKITATMRQVQPAACEIAKNPGATVEDVVGVIQNTSGINADTKAVINVLLAIYQTSTYSLGTNSAKAHPYLEAVICPGWAGGLALLPSGTPGQSDVFKADQVPSRNWILVK